MQVAVDTVVVLALINERDHYHKRARALFHRVGREGDTFTLPRIRWIELIGHLTRIDARGRDAATRKTFRVGMLDHIAALRWPILEHESEDHTQAESWWRKYADTPMGYPDLLIGATCHRIQSCRLRTFDSQFARFVSSEIPRIRLIREIS
ncbi:MAG: PIN domain-containing protein [Phycisphaerae bacterium]